MEVHTNSESGRSASVSFSALGLPRTVSGVKTHQQILLHSVVCGLLVYLLQVAGWAVASPSSGGTPCTPRVPVSGAVVAQAVTFAWQPLRPAVQAQLPTARLHPAALTGTLFWPRDRARRCDT